MVVGLVMGLSGWNGGALGVSQYADCWSRSRFHMLCMLLCILLHKMRQSVYHIGPLASLHAPPVSLCVCWCAYIWPGSTLTLP